MMNIDVSFVGGGAMSTPSQPIQNGRNSVAEMRARELAQKAARKQRMADAEAQRVEEARIAKEATEAAAAAAANAAAAADAAELAELTGGFDSWEDEANADAIAEPPTVVRQLDFAEVAVDKDPIADAVAPVVEPVAADAELVVAAPVECPVAARPGCCRARGG
jgi:hypothetical protein